VKIGALEAKMSNRSRLESLARIFLHSKPESVDFLLIESVVGHSTEVSVENF